MHEIFAHNRCMSTELQGSYVSAGITVVYCTDWDCDIKNCEKSWKWGMLKMKHGPYDNIFLFRVWIVNMCKYC